MAFIQSAGTVVLLVASARQVFIEAAHEPGDITKSLAPGVDDFPCLDTFGVTGTFPSDVTHYQDGQAEEFFPLLNHLVIRPFSGLVLIDTQHQVIVVGHDGVSADIDGEDIGQFA